MPSDAAHLKRNWRTPFRAAAVCALGAGLLLGSQTVADSQMRERPPETFNNPHYREALSRFPDLAACKSEGFLDDKISFFELFRVFDTRQEFEVCHYWYFASLPDPLAATQAYYKAAGIENTDILRIRENTYSQASWDPGELGVPFGGALSRWWIKTATYGAMISVRIDESGKVAGMQLVFSST
jgi:hypothetical protein